MNKSRKKILYILLVAVFAALLVVGGLIFIGHQALEGPFEYQIR